MSSSDLDGGFVRCDRGRFTVDGHPFPLRGTNSYYQMSYRRWNAPGPDEVLDRLAERGMTLVRTWAFQDAVEHGAALLAAPARRLAAGASPLDYVDSQTLVALDQTLAAADQRGLRLILTLVNNWCDYGGIDRWTLWRFGRVRHDAFFSEPIIRRWYSDLAALLVNRVNSVNGRVYRDDPTLFAWELANEPRASSGAAGAVDDWIAEMSAHLKRLDPNHLVTTGIEGFYGPVHADRNPNSWMAACGTDFILNHRHSSVDFATCHLWPENWGWRPLEDTIGSLVKARHYLRRRLVDARFVLGKPLLCEEVGLPRDNCARGLGSGPTRVRDRFLQALGADLSEWNAAAGAGSNAGMLIWQVLHDGYSGCDDGNGIFLAPLQEVARGTPARPVPWDVSTDEILSAGRSGPLV